MSKNTMFLEYLKEFSITTLTEIQSLCFQPLYEGKSVFGLAPTGSGKTLAFVLPSFLRVDCANRNTQVLILVPTRELGAQIAQVAQQVSEAIAAHDQKNILVRTAFGGSPISTQIKEITKKPHVLIATPGRVIDLLERKSFDPKNIKTLILDEGDVMVGMGFADQVQAIYKELPSKLQVGLFSATQNEKVSELEELLLKGREHEFFNPSKKFHDSQVHHKYVFSKTNNRYQDLVTFLRVFESQNDGKIILFVHRRETAHQLADDLKQDGFSADALTGELGQIHRSSIMRNFKSGNLRYLVATNIAARGIDINQLSAVIHFDVPFTPEDYIHRSGRTGRSGYSEGSAITFCDSRTKSFYLKLIKQLELTPEEILLEKEQETHTHDAPKNKSPSFGGKFVTVYLNKGKQNKIRPGDILGAFINELSLKKEDIGNIFIFTNFTHIEVNADKKNLVVNKSFKVKNLPARTQEAK